MATELELPAVYLDAVVLDPTPARPVVINRDPEPGELQVPIGTSISLELTDTGPDGIDASGTDVVIGGVLAYSGGVFHPGFNGPGSSASNPQSDTLRLVIDPFAVFESLQDVTVRVITRTVGGAAQLDTFWTFKCQDLTAPRLVGAQARELKRVRISFDEPIKQEDKEDANDALNPSCYTLTRLSVPAIDALVVGIETATDSSVDVLTDLELTPGATYRLTAAAVVDLFGNQVIAPFNAAEFTAFSPVRSPSRRFNLYQLLPVVNRREDETGDLRRFLACLQEVTDLLVYDVDRFTDIFDPDLAPEDFIDAMLVDMGNPFPFDLSSVDKRRLLNVLVAIYREKGTEVGIENAIRFFLSLEVDVFPYTGESLLLGEALLGEDWILGPGVAFAAYSFEVVAPRVLEDEERRRLRLIVEYMKPAHTHFVRLVEPTISEVLDHVELGLSELGETWVLH